MKRSVSKFLVVAASMAASLPAFAEDGASPSGLKYLAAGIAIGLAVLGGGTGQGRAASSAYEAIGRNPQAADKIFTPMLLGLALIEFQTIMAFIIAILLVI